MARGILYVMTTVVPGLIKIGRTGTDKFEARMYYLEHNGYANVTGLKRRFAIEVEDYCEKEILLDNIFSKSNVVGTELFAIDENIVVQLLSSFDGKVVYPVSKDKEKVFDDATAEVTKQTEQESIGKAKRFSFSMVDIPVGAELTYVGDPAIKVKVADEHNVIYQDEVYSMSALAQKLRGRFTATQGTLWFAYNGKKLTDLRKEKEAKK